MLTQMFQGNEYHRGVCFKNAQGKTQHILEKNKRFDWDAHIKGIKAQGLSPLRQKTNQDEAYCIFGGLDFDLYKQDAKAFCQYIYSIYPELFVFQTKSGGFHVYYVADDWIKAEEMKQIIERLKKKINPKYPVDRIIPKETKLKNIDTQCGFWFNMPYLNGSDRKCLNHLGDPLSQKQFELKYKLRKHYFLASLVGWREAKKGTGVMGRHNALFRASLYAQYKLSEDRFFSNSPSDREDLLRQLNKSFEPPIDDEREIQHQIDDGSKYDEDHLENNLPNYYAEIGIKKAPVEDTNKPEGEPEEQTEEQKQFFENIWYVKKDDRFWDNRTNDEYRKEAINTAFTKIFKSEKKNKSPVVEFKNNPDAIIVESFIYRPDLYNENTKVIEQDKLLHINTYRPSDVESIEPGPGDLDPFMQLMEFLFPNEEYRTHVLDFICTNVQFPGRKIRFCILLYSKEFQIGKSSLFRLLRKVLGEHNCTIIGPRQAQDKGKGFLVDKQLVLIDELKSKADWDEKNTLLNDLKPMMTEDVHEIRPLYKDYKVVHTCTNYIIYTNYDDAISLPENEARYTVLEHLEKPKDLSFYKNFHKQIDEGKLVNHVKWYLEDRNVSEKFEPKGTCLRTPALEKMSKAGGHPILSKCRELLEQEMEPFDQDIVSISQVGDYLKKEKGIKGRANELSKALEKLGGISLGNAIHTKSKRKPTVYAMRNQQYYLKEVKSTSEVVNKYWRPIKEDTWGMVDVDVARIQKNQRKVEEWAQFDKEAEDEL